jgi:hypothetical protein
MLVPTSPAPMRITMLFGSLEFAWPLIAVGVTGFVAPAWVLFFERLLAMVMSDNRGDVVVPLNWMQLQEVQLTAVGQLQAGKNFGGAELIVHAPPPISP